MRLIDADALKDWIDCGHLRNPNELCFSELDVVQMLDKQPTIEAEPVRHGGRIHRTIWHTSGWGEIYTSYNCCGFQEKGKTHHNFCPNCGAKMDLE